MGTDDELRTLELREQLEAPLLIAYTHAAWAALLADRSQSNDIDRARTMAEQALTDATNNGYRYIEADARTVLDRLQ